MKHSHQVQRRAATQSKAELAFSQHVQTLDVKSKLKIRLIICYFLVCAVGFSLVACFVLIVLRGIGYQISEAFLQWLSGVTVAEVVALLGVFTRFVWKVDGQSPTKPVDSDESSFGTINSEATIGNHVEIPTPPE